MPEGRRPDPNQMRRQVLRLLEADLAADGFDLVDIRIFQGGGRTQVRVYVDLLEPPAPAEDADGPLPGISLDQVARASRTTGMLLEEADLFADRYVIEVSSPGIRRPLRKPDHFRRAVGEKIDLKLLGRSRVRGRLEAFEDGRLTVVKPAEGDAEPETVTVELDRIYEANLDPEFDAQAIINADRRDRKESRRRERQAKKKGRKKSRPKAGKTKNDAEPSGDA